MFNIGAGEMVFILIAALLVLGPQRLPELARGIGKFLREFRRQTDEVRGVVVREFYQMDQEIQREPVRPAPAPVPPHGTPRAEPTPSTPALPLPAGHAAHARRACPRPPPEPGEPSPAVGRSGRWSLGHVPPAAAAGRLRRPEAVRPPRQPEEEALPRFDPIPGTVARNAPK